MKKVIVIGGLSAGPSAAAKARREDEDAQILLFEKTANISYATCGIPYAISGVIDTREKLLVTDVENLQNRFKIDVHVDEEVLSVQHDAKIVQTTKGVYAYDTLIYATGARPVVPNIENLPGATNWSTCRSLSDFDKIKEEALQENIEHITVMGAGLIGIEVAENLVHFGKKVTILEGGLQILPMWQPKFSYFAERVLKDKGIEIIKNRFAKKVVVASGQITHIDLGEAGQLATDYLILSVGIKPNTEMLQALGAEVLGNGALVVDKNMQTSLRGIYAAGDNASIRNLLTNEHDYFPLGTHSNKGGRAAGYNAVTNNQGLGLNGGYKTAIVKIFDFTLARTGLGPKDLQTANIPFKRSLTIAGSTPGYYPNQKEILIETYYHANNHTLLGAELFGEHGVDKRVDVLSTAIYAKLKMEDLPQLDLAYAPPYAPAKDPVIVNGYVASNQLFGNYQEMSVEELHASILQGDDLQIIDLRTPKERLNDAIPGSINIPLDELREQIKQLDATKNTVVYCQKGMRGYIGYKILKHHGFHFLHNLAGGMKVWNMYTQECPVETRQEEYAS